MYTYKRGNNWRQALLPMLRETFLALFLLTSALAQTPDFLDPHNITWPWIPIPATVGHLTEIYLNTVCIDDDDACTKTGCFKDQLIVLPVFLFR